MPLFGQRHFEYGAAVRLTLDVDRAPEAPHKRTRVIEADTIARSVLNARSSEQIKDTLTIPCIDAATVVANLIGDRSIGFGRSDLDAPRHAGPQILDRVVHEIREHLFEGETVAGDRRKFSNADLGVNGMRLMSHCLQSRSQQLRHVDELRLKLTLPLARQLEKGADESIHFRNR